MAATARAVPTSDSIRAALPHALPVAAVMLGLYYYWFAVADRYAVFLYEHLGATPFDGVTSSRYWVAGLVAAALALLPYNAAIWLRARLAAARGGRYCPPDPWRVWLVAAVPVGGGVVLITATAGSPVLPLPNALGSAAAALIGLALGLLPAGMAARRPTDLVWLAADGLALVPTLLLLRAIELPGRGLAVTPTTAGIVAIGSVALGVVWLLVLSALRAWCHREIPPALDILLAGLAISYLGMPLAHCLLFTPAEFRYISTAANFFAASPLLQAGVFGVAGLLALGATALRHRLRPTRSRKPSRS